MTKEHFEDRTTTEVFTLNEEEIKELIKSQMLKKYIMYKKDSNLVVDFICKENCLDYCRITLTTKE
jgi:hypothetical protein